MATIKDYLRWRGDITFADRPFNVVDNIILSAISYIDLRGVVESGASLSLADALAAVLSFGDDITPFVRSMAAVDSELLKLVMSSARFGTAVVRDYVDEVDVGSSLQFSAMTFDLQDGPTAVVFRGTDHSLVGWRENFMLSFKVTLAQERAAAYLERAALGVIGHDGRLVVCGHSKGGNLATYASAVCAPELQGHIDHVWDDDGPGMASEVISPTMLDVLGDRLTHIVPEFSIVGMLFLRRDARRVIVRSTASGFLQHDLTTWEVGPDDVVRAERLSPESQITAEAFSTWLSNLSLADRETFTNELFDAMAAGSPDRIDAVFTSPAAVQRVLAASTELSPGTRLMMRTLVGTITATATEVAVATVRGLATRRMTE